MLRSAAKSGPPCLTLIFFLFFFFSVIRLPASWSLRVIGTSLAATPFTGQSAVVARKASLRALPLAEATRPFCAPVDTVRHVLFSPDEQRYYIPVSPRVRNPSFPISLALRHLCLPSARRCGWCWSSLSSDSVRFIKTALRKFVRSLHRNRIQTHKTLAVIRVSDFFPSEQVN